MTIIPLVKKYGGKEMKWNIAEIGFLHQPEHFLGSFDNPKMQERHEKELGKNLIALQTALAQESDPLKALNLLNPKDHIQFFINNLEEFRTHGRLEEAVISLYLKQNNPFLSGGDAVQWEDFFNECDKDRLKKCGPPLPAGTSKVYRGSVSGFKRSLAWTPDRKLIENFAERWKDPSLGGGQLYEVDISTEQVLVYIQRHINRRVEEIILLSPDFIRSTEIRSFQL